MRESFHQAKFKGIEPSTKITTHTIGQAQIALQQLTQAQNQQPHASIYCVPTGLTGIWRWDLRGEVDGVKTVKHLFYTDRELTKLIGEQLEEALQHSRRLEGGAEVASMLGER